jgi:tryptophanyl-tRNA synthetase
MAKDKPVLFTGIRPTGELHLGNYLGAIQPAATHQEQFTSYLCVVDLHAITTPYEPKKMPDLIRGITLDYLAGGIDPDKSTLFIQSHVPAHVELMWLLNTITPIGELQRMVQYKEFTKRHGDAQAGILNYPILMAADILLYKGIAVPVGDDQSQHLEMASDLAKKFNRLYGETFPIPKNTADNPPRIKALHDPSKQMAKSLGPKSYIAMTDDADTIRKKIMSAVTDTGDGNNEEMAPGVANLFTLLELSAPQETVKHMREHHQEGGLQYAELKAVLADHLIEYLKPIQERRAKLEKDPDYVVKVLTDGAERAREVADATLREVKEKMGLL